MCSDNRGCTVIYNILFSDTVGCSGLFCASLYCFERLIADNEVDVFGCVRLLRNDKPGIVPSLVSMIDFYSISWFDCK